MTARILNVTEAEYFADPCAVPSLSQSVARTIVSESPLHGWLSHPRLGNQRGVSTAALDEGTIIHKLLLGKGADVVLVDAPDFRTNAAKLARDTALAANKVPMLRSKFNELSDAAEQLRDKCTTLGFEFSGESEVAIEWTDDSAGTPVVCRSKLDHLILDRGVILDVKKTRNANPKYLQRNFFELGYDIQHAAYTRAVAGLRPDLVGRIDFVFLFLELEPPYSVVPARPDGAFREIGSSRWNRAVHIWQRCLKDGFWPGYCDRPVTLEAPHWVAIQELGSEA